MPEQMGNSLIWNIHGIYGYTLMLLLHSSLQLYLLKDAQHLFGALIDCKHNLHNSLKVCNIVSTVHLQADYRSG